MRADEFHQHALVGIGNMNDQPVPISGEIENHSIIAYEINGRAELLFYVGGRTPLSLGGGSVPNLHRGFRLWVPLPSLIKRADDTVELRQDTFNGEGAFNVGFRLSRLQHRLELSAAILRLF